MQSSSIRISDGDTIRLNNQRIRLACIDAPESDQPFGSQSTQKLSQLLGNGSNLRVQSVDTDRYGRTIAKLYVGDVYVQEALLRDGLAWVYTGYLDTCTTTAGSLLRAQEEAQLYRRGVWSSDESIAPWQWRQR
ncbi:MAG: thermonuclease family protein [Synechococcaceae cyanobacterium SM2_3_2]|nr:thermonuclease family protein [Synechococcaceae cyanobacterium SM2_3_2]